MHIMQTLIQGYNFVLTKCLQYLSRQMYPPYIDINYMYIKMYPPYIEISEIVPFIQ